MLRPLHLLLLGLLSCAVGLAVGLYGNEPALIGMSGSAILSEFVTSAAPAPWVAGSASALLIFLVAGFIIPAATDWWALAAIGRRLRGFKAQPTPAAFLSAFRNGRLRVEAHGYVAGLWQRRARADRPTPDWQSLLDPSVLLGPARDARESMGILFSQVSLALLAVGVASFFWLGRDGALGQTVSSIIIGLATALFLCVRMLTQILLQLISSIALSSRALFPVAEAEFLVDRMAALIGEDSDARALTIDSARRATAEGLDDAIKDLKVMLVSHDRRIAASVAAAVQRVAQPITASVQEALRSLNSENSAKAEQLLQAVLTEFLSGFQERFGAQMSQLGELLSETRILAEELRKTFADSEATLSSSTAQLGQTILDTLGQAVDKAATRQTEAMRAIVEQVDRSVLQAGASIERLGARTDAAMETWSERSKEIARAVIAGGGDELKRTASAFNQLHAILETLSISVLPAINKLVATQERLHATIESNHDTAHSVSTAARDLGEAAEVARQMVERQILLTRELAQLAHGGMSAGPTRDGSGLTPDPGLVRALDDLRAEADDDRKSLPSL